MLPFPMRGTVVHRFGPIELDAVAGRLFRGRQRVRLSTPQSAVLTHLVSHAGRVISNNEMARDQVIRTVWKRAPPAVGQ